MISKQFDSLAALAPGQWLILRGVLGTMIEQPERLGVVHVTSEYWLLTRTRGLGEAGSVDAVFCWKIVDPKKVTLDVADIRAP